MKIDASIIITDLNDKPIDRGDGKPHTVGTVIANALLNIEVNEASQQPTKVPGIELIRRKRLAERFWRGGKVGVPAEDFALAKKMVEDSYRLHGPLVIARTLEAIDPPPVVPNDDEPPTEAKD